jgi:hypothetical protein
MDSEVSGIASGGGCDATRKCKPGSNGIQGPGFNLVFEQGLVVETVVARFHVQCVCVLSYCLRFPRT